MTRATVLITLMAAIATAAPVIVIDPGHGGTQEGASSGDGLLEKRLVLSIAKMLQVKLQAELGATVKLTRDDDTRLNLDARVLFSNRQRPDLFLSIHANSMPTAGQRGVNEGIETYFLSLSASGDQAKRVAARENAEAGSQPKARSADTLSFILADLQKSEAHQDSSRLAYAVHESVIGRTGAKDRGVQQAPFYVLMGLNSPAILIEVGFISHPREGERLADPEYQQRIADSIASGIKQFLAQVAKRDAKKESPSSNVGAK